MAQNFKNARSISRYPVFLVIKRYFVLNRNTATQTVQQELLFVGQEPGKLLAVRDIVQKVSSFITVKQQKYYTFNHHHYGMLQQCHCFYSQGFQPPMLIFVQSKERAKELFQELIYDGINVDVIHSDRTQAQVLIVFYVHALFIKYQGKWI